MPIGSMEGNTRRRKKINAMKKSANSSRIRKRCAKNVDPALLESALSEPMEKVMFPSGDFPLKREKKIYEKLKN